MPYQQMPIGPSGEDEHKAKAKFLCHEIYSVMFSKHENPADAIKTQLEKYLSKRANAPLECMRRRLRTSCTLFKNHTDEESPDLKARRLHKEALVQAFSEKNTTKINELLSDKTLRPFKGVFSSQNYAIEIRALKMAYEQSSRIAVDMQDMSTPSP